MNNTGCCGRRWQHAFKAGQTRALLASASCHHPRGTRKTRWRGMRPPSTCYDRVLGLCGKLPVVHEMHEGHNADNYTPCRGGAGSGVPVGGNAAGVRRPESLGLLRAHVQEPTPTTTLPRAYL